ncbi:MAG: hypothetical protein COU81_02870 [Candidatus Portnoybacteria bacterium CG10_big_fil_rev_8_21_14_0_10_36_7]|uniref:Uncharacterized protein n=1 Tax=Candidatus Portnoybacteria bacterium CG10_big_fil_rev_8_21_14_0_10_36_7 TaxID=1974812 RepID=A0A2M8KDP6_9BACT|nr:MAG: hypothetical protein COU81_02870 [Candidatus Portnoybacteria bacterium CG10_big_fil_rev_8_21_14_0_10_36_7]
MPDKHHIRPSIGFGILAVALIVPSSLFYYLNTRPTAQKNSRAKTEITSKSPNSSTTTQSLAVKQPAKHFLNLQAAKSSSILKAEGETNVPNGSKIAISVDRAYSVTNDAKSYNGSLGVAEATVIDQKYSVVFNISDHTWYDPTSNYYKLLTREVKLGGGKTYNLDTVDDKVVITASFQPKEQNENILKIINTNGDQLTGPDVYQSPDGSFLLKKQIEMTIPFALPKQID